MTDMATVSIELERDAALALFEFLHREIDENDGSRIRNSTTRDGGLWALNELSGSLERVMFEPFRKDYRERLSRALESLIKRRGPWPV